MDLFSIFTIAGGLAFFLYGMHVMSNGLEKIAGGKLEHTLTEMTSNKFKSIALGAGITIAIQSSSAMTVMLVGLVNSGIMHFEQTLGVILGSDIGTTLTAWVLSLAGIESNNVYIRLLKPESFSPIIALIGIILIMAAKKQKRRDIGSVFVGFAVLMFGMQLMTGVVSENIDSFSGLLTKFSNPFLGVVSSTLFTGIIQSSAATVGMVQALALTGKMSLATAIPLILGANIGTCMTALLSSFGTNKNAKRVVALHIYIKVIGVLIFMILLNIFMLTPLSDFLNNKASAVTVAAIHTVFNVVNTIILLPCSGLLIKLTRKTVKTVNSSVTFIDDRLLNTPTVAIEECRKQTEKMALLSKELLQKSMSLFDNFDKKVVDEIKEKEETVDMYEDKLGTYLVKISGKELSDSDSKEISKLLHLIGNFERLGDHAVNLLRVAEELADKGLSFSKTATDEIDVVRNAINEIIDLSIDSFTNNDTRLACMVEPLEQVIDDLLYNVKSKHIERLQSGNCTIELGFVLSDLLTNYERISDHCSNIAVCIIQINVDSFDTHDYLNSIKNSDNAEFMALYNDYSKKYKIPEQVVQR